MNDVQFSLEELATLREHGVVLFADRVIFDAQPPMAEPRIAEIEAQCAGPIPEALSALWRRVCARRPKRTVSLGNPSQ